MDSIQADISFFRFRVLDKLMPVFVLRQNRFLSENDQQCTSPRNGNVHALLALQESETKLHVALEESRAGADGRDENDFSLLALELFDSSDFHAVVFPQAVSDDSTQIFDLQ